MMFRWLRRKPDPQIEAMEEKVARGDRAIEAKDHVLAAAIKHTDRTIVRMENRNAAVKRQMTFDEEIIALFRRAGGEDKP